ncbi:hypothetical protein CYLTODRAFT_383345 [Cylindrobasidium torrendii FP15055 ss-10]|uniref:Protein YOP1 n=1 Tax=Cylindrobasidium torrendii FP15055 ss-10 TaxID=1314674 RepID=A0A0D7AXB5_9AGAR|nr:hypothetical protein CYLTODRAFT_383345 [Cylindrobasidium torrendii FP15055 ss-10]
MLGFIFSALCAWFAFFLPCFATFKVLRQRPVSEPELERITMYWSVIAAFVGFEWTAGWLINWLPFYNEAKTVFLLFLSLPQTQGSTFIYKSYLEPFFVKNERIIDDGIVSLQGSVVGFVQSRIAAIWELAWSVINKTPPPGQPPAAAPPQTQPGLSVENIKGMWNTYGPSLVNALQQGKAGFAAPRGPSPSPAGSATSSAMPTPYLDQRQSYSG